MPKGKVAEKSPLMMEMQPGTYYWCACGKSQNQPFCDGSHKGSEFSPKEVKIPEVQTVFWCRCKQTDNPPFCDGSHKKL
ncbi:CDGSH iron-sulfur domain-containing protein [Sunxiuqinia elliptica]|uniref:Iron-binding CDGSH zinc finger protein n=1 Tax=Sunxiuqinia elliptica TaxID=655355 RepID=A0A1I2IL18_9BACT|nr:CDGSH iron-sulfur domain-containing protein [Sunxiuqinia elliptica]TDN97131.1 iron-binding CDGSH zinc finger protein [Sunxiuqinia elliptica]TDO60684.1 iron-binding CDGSH zinc finger protein [Sunxiuqinia elliptica]SFF41737.1 Iron-binding zinc finger CDGSH type [Sunxiuqinia elliptica]